MVITGLALQNFRVYSQYFLRLMHQTTVIVGENAIGKTSIVEAIHLLSSGNSFRAGKVAEMISFNEELARVKGVIIDPQFNGSITDESLKDTPKDEVEILLTHGSVNGKKTHSRLFNVNGVRRRKKDAAGKFYTVVFRPEDMRLIEGSKARRRSFLDTVLSLLYRDYEVSVKNYDQTLRRRNKLLSLIKDGQQPETVLQYWDFNLVKYGTVLQNYRKRFIETFSSVEFPVEFSITYDPSVISQERIDQYRRKAIAAGHTLIGPHKDDFQVFIQANDWRITKNQSESKVELEQSNHQNHPVTDINVATFGSRGQQRLAVLWLKFCELDFLRKHADKKTILLLDDILSELDDESKVLALSVLKDHQAIITTIDDVVIDQIKKVSKDTEVITLEN